jgi:hypothetical protein
MNILTMIPASRRRVTSDPDALDYFSRAEALGGSFDQTAINALYTEAYMKSAISDCIAGLKTDAVWDKITELYLMAGVTFPGLMAKVKHAGTEASTNVGPFDSGDYLAAGSGAGLKGDATTKRLNTEFGTVAQNDITIGAYITEAPSAGGTIVGRATDGNFRLAWSSGSTYVYRLNQTPSVILSAIGETGQIIVTRRGPFDCEAYKDGSSFLASSAASTTTGSGNIFIFSNGDTLYSNQRLPCAYLCDGLTGTEAANLSSRINTLMTALGCNVY